jgi:CelD/BcsL family acetyltransferase involved in cellulose biosynthesis
VSAALSVLTAEIRRLPWPLLWFDAVPLKAWRWQQLLAALNAAGHQHLQRERFRMGTVKIVSDAERDWAAYEAAWSGNHRRHMRKALRRAGEAGGVQLDIRRPGNPDEIESLLREGFEVEHRSWKGEHRSSVLSSQVQWDFFLREATQLAESGELELAFLRHAGRAIAFEYGWFSQGIYYTPKVGFDSEFAHLSPGQLLRYLLLKRAFERPEYRAVDFLGPLSEATCKWSTHSYPISKLAIETGNVYGRGLLSLYRNIAGLLRKLRRGRPQCDDNLPLVHIEQQSATGLPSQAVEV